MKNWSFGKLIGVGVGGFVSFIIVAVLVIKMISPKSSEQRATTRSQTGSAVQIKPAPKESISATVTAAPTPQQSSVNPDIVSVQLESAQIALREARDATKTLENKLATALATRDDAANKQAQALQEQILVLSKRLSSIEDARTLNPGITVIGPNQSAPASELNSPKTSNAYTPPKGFTVRARLGDRVWLTDGQREISVLKTEPPPALLSSSKQQGTRASSEPTISTASGL